MLSFYETTWHPRSSAREHTGFGCTGVLLRGNALKIGGACVLLRGTVPGLGGTRVLLRGTMVKPVFFCVGPCRLSAGRAFFCVGPNWVSGRPAFFCWDRAWFRWAPRSSAWDRAWFRWAPRSSAWDRAGFRWDPLNRSVLLRGTAHPFGFYRLVKGRGGPRWLQRCSPAPAQPVRWCVLCKARSGLAIWVGLLLVPPNGQPSGFNTRRPNSTPTMVLNSKESSRIG